MSGPIREGAGIAIDEALGDPVLLGAALGERYSWSTWFVVLRAAFGLRLSTKQLQVFGTIAGGRTPPLHRVRELWAIVGRRGGKSKIAAAIAVFLALFIRHRLSRGERGMILVLAATQDQAKVVFEYAKSFLTESPLLRQEIDTITRSEIRLRNGISIAIHANSFRTVRGRTLCACVFDEVALWRDEYSATPDVEVYTAVLPSLITTNGMLIGISTAYRRMGLLFEKHRDYFGVESADTLVVQGSTLQFNQTLDETAIAAQRAANPAASASEWDGTFRTDSEAYLSEELIEAAIEHGRPLELPPIRDRYVSYRAFCDASGGVGHDSYTLAIGHKEGELFVIDLVRGTPRGKPFDPYAVTEDYAKLCKEYRIGSVVGDKYGREWVSNAWQKCGIRYQPSTLVKNDIYRETIVIFTRHLVRLPDHSHLITELRLLERIAHRGGHESIDHPKNGHDDYANAVCGVLRELSNYRGYSLDALSS
jgi:terminase large subunit-like protein